jgi:predicted ATP-dependent serine protease
MSADEVKIVSPSAVRISISKWLGKCPDCGQWNSLVEESAANFRQVWESSATFSAPARFSEIIPRR